MPLSVEVPDARLVSIFDTTLRDGEQAPGNAISPDRKVEIALTLESLGVDLVETGFPASSATEREATRLIAQSLSKARVVTFSRSARADIAAAVEAAGVDRHQVQVMATGSDMHLVHKRGITRQAAVAEVRDAVAFAGSLGVSDVSVPVEDASRGEDDLLRAIVEAALEEGARTFVLGDTSGCLTPQEYADLVRRFRSWAPSPIVISTHCHNDLGLSLANAIAGVMAGADEIQATLGGIGERAGNTPLEEVAAVLAYKGPMLGLASALRTEGIHDAYGRLRRAMQLPEPRNKPVVGTYAFSTAAGVHQQGMLANPSTYEYVEPERFGRHRQVLISRHSGRVVLRHVLQQLGAPADDAQVDALYERYVLSRPDGDCETIDDLRVRLLADPRLRPESVAHASSAV